MEKDIFEIIESYSKKVKTERHPKNVFLQVVEEVGELGKEIRVKYDDNYYKQGDVDGIIGESCDILISLLDLMVLEGLTKDEILETINKKCQKWLKNNTK